MYRSCIFCSAPLGSNVAIEHFPVGRSLAFDGEKGRLWAVCGRCARWNLAPIEERWEAVEEAERLFRDTRLRVQRENIGLARLKDGTRLVRVGVAPQGELAAWRYGRNLVSRRRRAIIRGIPAAFPTAVVGAAVAPLGVAGALAAGAGALLLETLVENAVKTFRQRSVVMEARMEDGSRVWVQRRHLANARLAADGHDLQLRLPPLPRDRRFLDATAQPLVLRGEGARRALGRAMVLVNAQGATRRQVDLALGVLWSAGSPREMLLSAGRQGLLVNGARAPGATGRMLWAEFARIAGAAKRSPGGWDEDVRALGASLAPDPSVALALEMALHEETERRALEGELAMLQAMWREAEQIAAIADRLPDVPAPDPPRIGAGG